MVNPWESVVSASDQFEWESIPLIEPEQKSSFLQTYEENVPRPLKGVYGAAEGFFTGAESFVAGTLAKGAGHIAGGLTGKSVEETEKLGQEWQDVVSISPKTELGKVMFEGLGEFFEWARKQYTTYAQPRQDPPGWDRAKQGPYNPSDDLNQDRALRYLKRRAAAEGINELTFDLEMAKGGIISPLVGIKKRGEVKAQNQALEQARERMKAADKDMWEDVVTRQEGISRDLQMQDMEALRRDVEPMLDENLRSPYRVTPEERIRLEEELNPPIEARQEGQGELFTGREALTPDELMARRFVIADEGIGARDKPQSAETLFEIGKEAERPTYTADMIDAASRQRGVPEAGIPYDLTGVREALKPGFLRDATELIRAREFNRLKEPEFVGIRRNQGGVIDPELLLLGTGRLWEKLRDQYPDMREAATRLMDKFKGTFNSRTINDIVRNSSDPKSRETIGLMSPDDFHRASTFRTPDAWWDTSPKLRESIRKGLKTNEGLTDIPYLEIVKSGNNWYVFEHNGRHRMDIFQEQGMDLIPVRIKLYDLQWGENKERPDRLISQEGFSIPFPDSIFFPGEKIPELPPVPLKQRGAIGDWKTQITKDINKKGIVPALLEQKKALEREVRPLSQIIKDERIDPKTIEDLGLQGKLSSVLIDKTVSILAQSKTGTGKILKWAQDGRERITQARNVAIENGMHELLGPWRILTEPRVSLARIQARRQRHRDLREMITVWQENVGKSDLVREHFKNDKQWSLFREAHDFIDRKLQDWNAVRESRGLKPFDRISNYFPAIWEGDYRVWIKDQAGTNVGVRGFSNLFQAKFAKQFIQKEHPEYIVEDPVHVSKRQDYHDFSAFEEAMRLNTHDYAAFADLQKTYSRLMRQKGYGAHGLYRQNLFGYLGQEKGNLGIKNSEKALELWLRRGETHVANIEMSKLQESLHKDLPIEIQEKIPQAMEYMDSLLSNARGVKLGTIKLLDSMFQEAGYYTGFGRSGPERTLANVSGVASLFKILTEKFLGAQLMQPLVTLAKLRQLNIRLPESGNFIESFYHGYQGVIWPQKIHIKALEWAEKQGYFTSAVVAMMKMRQSDLTVDAGNRFLDSGRLILSLEEKYVVRMPTFLAFEHLLRKDFPDDIQRFQIAADHLYYVVNYGPESSPLIYSKLGLAGEAARPMKQFAHNYFGQFLEYVQGAVNKKEFSPLAMFMAQQISVAGLRGLIGLAEYTAIITLINNLFETDYPTPESWLLKSGQSDLMVFGLPSTLTGLDFSSSVNAPNIPQMFSLFPIAVGGEALAKTFTYFLHLAKGQATQRDEMAALLAISPNAMHGWIEEYYSKPGQPVPKPGLNMQGTYIRTEEEKIKAWLQTPKGLPEARKDMEMRVLKQLWQRDALQKLQAIDVIADRMLAKQPVDAALYQQYLKEGGNPDTLMETVKQRLISRSLPFNQRQFIGPTMTPEKLHKLDTMKDILNRDTEEKKKEKGFFIKEAEGADVPSLHILGRDNLKGQELHEKNIEQIEKQLKETKNKNQRKYLMQELQNERKNLDKYISPKVKKMSHGGPNAPWITGPYQDAEDVNKLIEVEELRASLIAGDKAKMPQIKLKNEPPVRESYRANQNFNEWRRNKLLRRKYKGISVPGGT